MAVLTCPTPGKEKSFPHASVLRTLVVRITAGCGEVAARGARRQPRGGGGGGARGGARRGRLHDVPIAAATSSDRGIQGLQCDPEGGFALRLPASAFGAYFYRDGSSSDASPAAATPARQQP
eukprot:gene1374-biopygen8171